MRGELRGTKGFRINGTVDGSVETTGAVVIGEDGVVTGSVRGADVVVLGRVEGEVNATGHIELGPRGRILGDVRMTSVRVHRGGALRGMSAMPLAEEPDAVAESVAPPPVRALSSPPMLVVVPRSPVGPPPLPPEATSGHRLVAGAEPSSGERDAAGA